MINSKRPINSNNTPVTQSTNGLSTVVATVSTTPVASVSTSTPQGGRNTISPSGTIQCGISKPIQTK